MERCQIQLADRTHTLTSSLPQLNEVLICSFDATAGHVSRGCPTLFAAPVGSKSDRRLQVRAGGQDFQDDGQRSCEFRISMCPPSISFSHITGRNVLKGAPPFVLTTAHEL